MKIAHDPLKDFAPIGFIVYVPYVLVVTGGLAANGVREFIEDTQRWTKVIREAKISVESVP